MDHRFKTEDCPGTKGHPELGAERWTIHFPLNSGDVLYVSMGRKARDLLFGMLIADCQDNGEDEPAG